MFGLAETKLFARDKVGELREFYRAQPSMEHGLLRSLSEIMFGEQTVETIETVRGWLAENDDMSAPELFRAMQAWLGERRLIDKSPLHVYDLEALRRMSRTFPDARYLHLTRHPGEMVKSAFQLREKIRSQQKLRRHMPKQRPNVTAPDTMWFEPHVNILEFLETVPAHQQLRLRGEDLLSDPPTYLRQIAEWLGVRADPSDIEAMMHPENSAFAAYGPRNARFGIDPNFMERPHLRPFTYTPRPLVWEGPNGETIELSEQVRDCAMIFGY